MTHTKILAIKPGKRLIGVAYIENGKLLYWGVKAIAPKIPVIRNVVLRLIRDLKPRTLAVENIYFPNVCPAVINGIVKEISAIGKRKRIKVVKRTPSTVRKFLTGSGHATKREASQAVAGRYPELRALLNQNRRWKEKYHQKAFDAVALGLLAEAED